jgi:hypothetical protein
MVPAAPSLVPASSVCLCPTAVFVCEEEARQVAGRHVVGGAVDGGKVDTRKNRRIEE